MKTTVGRRGKRVGIIVAIIALLGCWIKAASLLLILFAVAIVMLLGGLFVSFAVKAAKVPPRQLPPEETNGIVQIHTTWNHPNPLVPAPYVAPEEVRPTFSGTLYFSNVPENAILGVLRTRDYWTFELLYSVDLDGWTEGDWTELRFTDLDASEPQGFYTGIVLFP